MTEQNEVRVSYDSLCVTSVESLMLTISNTAVEKHVFFLCTLHLSCDDNHEFIIPYEMGQQHMPPPSNTLLMFIHNFNVIVYILISPFLLL